jgi:hypothetical protein
MPPEPTVSPNWFVPPALENVSIVSISSSWPWP